MMDSQTTFYVTGGTLKRTALSYVARQADQDLYDGLSSDKFCYVLTSRQMGKSSLMVRTAARLRDEGVSVAVLDLTAIGQNLTAEQWYDGLLARVGQQLDLEDELEDFWLEHERLGPLQRWMLAIREIVLTRHKQRIVIFVDEIDAVRSLPFSTDEFFAGIREFYNRRTEDAEFNRLTFCLLGVATPSDLIRDVRTTPFNIGQRIELTDFTEAEGAPLAEGLGHDPKLGEALINRILYWTGGHPYLTQRLCHAVAQDASVKSTSGVDRICEALFLSTRARESDDNLLFVRERILRSEADRASILDLYAQIRTHKKRVRDDEINPLISILRLSGITRIISGCHYVRNRIYYRVFDREWVMANMPDAELRRQRAAYRRGQLRAAAIAGIVLLVMAALAGVAIAKAREANRNAIDLTKALAEAREQRKIAEERRVEAESQRSRAIDLQKVSDERRSEAEEQRKIADQQKSLAETQRALAESAALEAQRQSAARTEAETLKQRAESRLKDDLRYVKSSLESQDWIVSLADRLIALSPPKEASYYRSLKAGTLSQLGQYKQARDENTKILELEPEDFDAHMSRGYMNILLDDIEKSVADFDFTVIKNPRSALGYLNRSVGLAMLASKRRDEQALDESALYYQKALADIDNAINYFVPGFYSEVREDHLSQDVQEEIGRSVLVVDENAFHSALYYQRVTLLAIAGRDFTAALVEAEKHPTAKEGYLTAIIWAWLHEQHSKTDYAALASQGILWERVENKEMALRSYAKFRCAHSRTLDPRYNNLDSWVARRMRDLKFTGSPCAFANPPELKPDVSRIALMVTQSLVAGDRAGAMELLNQGLKLEPHNIDFLLKRSDYNFEMRTTKDSKEEKTKLLMQSRMDADAVLQLVPSSIAYFYRARANNWMDASNDLVEPDLRKALELNPTMVGAMTYLASIISDQKPEEALELYEKSARLSYQGAWLYQSIAMLQLKVGRPAQALQSIEMAIETKSDTPEYYEQRADIESKLNRKEPEVQRHLAEGYTLAGDKMLRQGDVEGALTSYEKAKEVVSKLVKSTGSPDAACTLTLTNEKISSLFDASKAPISIEDVTGVILSMDSSHGKVREATVDRGTEDGVMTGAEGEVWSVYSLAGEPEREVKMIGRALVVRSEPRTAIVRLTLIDPSGNGLARVGDGVELKTHVPNFPGRSFLWKLARYHVTYTSLDDKTVYFDYRKLYAHQSPALVDEMLDAMLQDIHRTGRERADQVRSAPLDKGDQKGKTLRQGMEAAKREDLIRFLKFIATYPARSYGHQWRISERYGTWLMVGTPAE